MDNQNGIVEGWNDGSEKSCLCQAHSKISHSLRPFEITLMPANTGVHRNSLSRFHRPCQKKRLDPHFCSLIGFSASFFNQPREHERTEKSLSRFGDSSFQLSRYTARMTNAPPHRLPAHFVYSDEMGRFEFGPDHPFKPERATKTMRASKMSVPTIS